MRILCDTTLAVMSLALLAPAAKADGIMFQEKIGEELEVDTNPLLAQSGERMLWGSITSPEVTLSSQTPSLTLSGDTRIDIAEFNLPGFSSTDVYETGIGSLTLERLTLGGTIALAYDTTRTSEVATSGTSQAGIRHTGLTVAPQLIEALTPTVSAQLSGTYQLAEYSSKAYTEYQTYNIQPGLSWNATPTGTALLLFNANRYQTIDQVLGSTIESAGPAVTWKEQFSERLTGSLNVGTDWIDQKTAGTKSSISVDYLFDSTITYILSDGLSSINLTAARGLTPTSFEHEIIQTRSGATLNLALTPLLTAKGDLLHQINDASSGSLPHGSQNEYFSGDLSITYSLTETLKLQSTYQYREETFQGSGVKPDSSSVIISLTYSPVQHTLGFLAH